MSTTSLGVKVSEHRQILAATLQACLSNYQPRRVTARGRPSSPHDLLRRLHGAESSDPTAPPHPLDLLMVDSTYFMDAARTRMDRHVARSMRRRNPRSSTSLTTSFDDRDLVFVSAFLQTGGLTSACKSLRRRRPTRPRETLFPLSEGPEPGNYQRRWATKEDC